MLHECFDSKLYFQRSSLYASKAQCRLKSALCKFSLEHPKRTSIFLCPMSGLVMNSKLSRKWITAGQRNGSGTKRLGLCSKSNISKGGILHILTGLCQYTNTTHTHNPQVNANTNWVQSSLVEVIRPVQINTTNICTDKINGSSFSVLICYYLGRS